MSQHEETEYILESTLTRSTSEFNSNSGEAVSNQNRLDSSDFHMVTRIPKKSYEFQWIIRQFSTLSKNEELFSTCIHALATTCYQLKLVKYEHGFGLFHVSRTRMQPNETKEASTLSSSFSFDQQQLNGPFVFASSSSNFRRKKIGSGLSTQTNILHTEEAEKAKNIPIKLKYQVSATINRGKELMKWSVCFPDANGSLGYKIGEYINNNLEIFPDDSLILKCNLKVILNPTTEEIPIAFKPSLESNGWKKLSMDFKAIYQNSVNTDVTLISGTDKIHAHKTILTARSTVFSKIFDHDMKEAEQNSVAISDVKFSALQRLIEFLYTGVIEDDENKDIFSDLQKLYDIYYAADKYDVMDLREMVGNALLGRIQEDNASKILIWADRHNDKDLKSRVMHFIRFNFEVVATTDEWESCALHHPRLAMEVVNFFVKNVKDNETLV